MFIIYDTGQEDCKTKKAVYVSCLLERMMSFCRQIHELFPGLMLQKSAFRSLVTTRVVGCKNQLFTFPYSFSLVHEIFIFFLYRHCSSKRPNSKHLIYLQNPKELEHQLKISKLCFPKLPLGFDVYTNLFSVLLYLNSLKIKLSRDQHFFCYI